MRRISLAVILLGVLLSFGANAQTVTTGQYRHPKSEKDLTFNKSYLVGIKDGLLAYNMSSEDEQFCIPENASLTFDQTNDILLHWANKKGGRDDLPLGLTLLNALKETYPCPK
jgi:hypothetical protein